VYVVEQNRDGQMFGLLRMELDPALTARLRSVRHFNGLPIDARSVTDDILAQESVNRAELTASAR
jgi:2-oxoglutarate ferredoxin oxidoreductase subunit alpha